MKSVNLKLNQLIKYSFLMLIFFSITSCSLYQEVEMLGVQNFEIGEIKEGKVAVKITVKVNNPNLYSIKLKQTALDLFVEGKSVGQAIMEEDIKIEKNKEKEYEFIVSANYKDLSKSAFTILRKALFQKTIQLQAKGSIRAVVYGLIRKTIALDIKKDVAIKDLMKKFN